MGFFNQLLKALRSAAAKTKPATTAQKTEETAVHSKVYGNRGRLEIPDLFISVPLYDTSTGGAQQIIDRQNSAVFLRWNAQNAIADHSDHANFENLKNAIVGKTNLYIDTPNSRVTYQCVKKQIGHIKISDGGNRIFDENWQSPYVQNAGGLCLYTCIARSQPDVMDVRLTYWQPIPEEATP